MFFGFGLAATLFGVALLANYRGLRQRALGPFRRKHVALIPAYLLALFIGCGTLILADPTLPKATPTPQATLVAEVTDTNPPATNTIVPPTATAPATAAPVPQASTHIPETASPVPATAPATAAPVPQASTPIPATATRQRPIVIYPK